MARNYGFLIHLFTFLSVNVSLTTTQRPVFTRYYYDPCGLGMILFDKILDNYWKGFLYVCSCSDFVEVNTNITFKSPVVIYMLPDQTSFDAKRTTTTNLLVRQVAPIPNYYIFHVKVLGDNGIVPVVSEFVINGASLCSDDFKAAQAVQSFDISPEHPEETYAHICGKRFMEHAELISMRTEAEAGDWPWHVAILIRAYVNILTEYDCGGTILSWTAVLTAGHCIHKNSELLEPFRVIVIAGTNNYKDYNQTGRQVLIAKKLILHPAYIEELSTSDLGIVKVAGFRFTKYVHPIHISGPRYDKTELFGKQATIVGFGSTENNTNADILKVLNTLVRNDSTCNNFNPKLYTKLMNEFTFCAGYGPDYAVNPRNGDSGGGLVVSTLEPDSMVSWLLRGVLSKCGVGRGGKVCDPTYYVVYTNVGPHHAWISHHADLGPYP